MMTMGACHRRILMETNVHKQILTGYRKQTRLIFSVDNQYGCNRTFDHAVYYNTTSAVNREVS